MKDKSYSKYKEISFEETKQEATKNLGLIKLVFNESGIKRHDKTIEKFKTKLEDIESIESFLDNHFHIRAWGDEFVTEEAIKKVFADRFDYYEASYLWLEVLSCMKAPIKKLIPLLHFKAITENFDAIENILKTEENEDYAGYIESVKKWRETVYFKKGFIECFNNLDSLENIKLTKTDPKVFESHYNNIYEHLRALL